MIIERIPAMNKRGVGAVFIVVSAMLFCTKYISAAILGIGNGNQILSKQIFIEKLSYVGGNINLLSMLALIVGIYYLVLADNEVFQVKMKKLLTNLIRNLKR
jgi:hypothetical protein